MHRPAIAIGMLLLTAVPASAQYIGGGFGPRGGFGFSVHRPGFHFSYSRSYFYSAPMFGFAWVPLYGPGYGPGFGNPFFLPAPPFAVPAANNAPFEAPPEVVKADFHVIVPRKRDEVAVFPKVKIDPFAKIQPVGLTEPARDAAQWMKLARESLAAGEYGTAVEHLDRILPAQPNDAAALFLKSQALFAAGQYVEAVAVIRAGLKADPKWSAIAIDPQHLFGKPERFDGLFGDLKRSRDANPDSAALQFLIAHQHWFAGDRDAAKAAFRKVADRLNDADILQPFLK